MAQWYYAKNGQQSGPVDEAGLRQLIASGQVGGSDLVWKDGMPGWVSASTVPELGGAASPGGIPMAPIAPPGAQPLQYGGYVPPRQPAGQPVPNYLVQSILVTILCCWPLGIPAIVFAAQVNGKLASGDYAGAVDASNKAKMFSWIAFGLGLLVGVIYLVAIIVGAAAKR